MSLIKDSKNFISILTSMIAVVLSTGVPNVGWQIVFVVFYIVWVILFLEYRQQSNLKKVFCWFAGAICVLIIAFSVYGWGSVGNYINKVISSFTIEQDENTLLSEKYADNYKDINERLTHIDENINVLRDDMEYFSDSYETSSFIINKMDQYEIDNIVEEIKNLCDEKKEEFGEIITNKYQLELFYKTFLTEEPYCYYNIIKAFEKYGINCERQKIDVGDLIVWDMHVLYITYAIKDSFKNKLDSNEVLEDAFCEYKDFKVEMGEYSDTFFYDSWGVSYNDKTAKEIDQLLNDRIMNYYKKFIINFSDNVN